MGLASYWRVRELEDNSQKLPCLKNRYKKNCYDQYPSEPWANIKQHNTHVFKVPEDMERENRVEKYLKK